MKPAIKKQFSFIGRSLLWSLLLYVVMMLAFNWDEVSNTVKGNNTITVVTHTLPEPQFPYANDPGTFPANISKHTGIIVNIVSLVKDIYSITGNN